MTGISQRRKGNGKVIPALNTAIDFLNLAKDATSTTPGGPVIGAVATLLTMIRVSSLLFRNETFQAHTQSGYDGQQTGLRRSGTILRRYL